MTPELNSIHIFFDFFCFMLKSIFFSPKRAPYISTFDRHLDLMKQLNIKPKTNLVDL